MGWILLQRIVEWIRAKRLLVRQRKDDQLKALAVLLYYLGLSCRKTRDILREWEDVSHEAIRQWYHRIGDAFPRLRRKHRRTVAIDETQHGIDDASTGDPSIVAFERKNVRVQ